MIKKFFKRDEGPKNLKEVIKHLDVLKEDLKKTSKDLEKLKEESKLSIQKIGMVRFNPFKETGGDQSFSIALLNKENTGVVITSLYCRDDNRVYAKSIKNSKSQHLLSKEEEQAIAKAKEC